MKSFFLCCIYFICANFGGFSYEIPPGMVALTNSDSKMHYKFYDVMIYSSNSDVNGSLSNSSSPLDTNIKLTFDFLYYGNKINTIKISQSGFIYLEESTVNSKSAIRYIAPFMATFSTNSSTHIFHKMNDRSVQVKWEKVILANDVLTFEAELHENGTIVFVFYQLPPALPSSVKVGISDGYQTLDSKMIIEYNHISVNLSSVQSGGLIVLWPNPTCTEQSSCKTCIYGSAELGCKWCRSATLCSASYERDRNYPAWQGASCSSEGVSSQCDSMSDGTVPVFGVVLFLLCLFTVGIGGGIIYFCYYAYKHPNTASGTWLLRYGSIISMCRWCGSKCDSCRRSAPSLPYRQWSFRSSGSLSEA